MKKCIAILLFAGAVLGALALNPPPARACYNYCVYIQCMLEDRFPYGYFRGNRYDIDDYVLLEGGAFDCDGYIGIIFPQCIEYACGGGGGGCPPMYGGHWAAKNQDVEPATDDFYIAVAKRKLVHFVVAHKDYGAAIVFLQRNLRTNREKLVKQVTAKFHPISVETVSPDEDTLVGSNKVASVMYPCGSKKVDCLKK